MRRFGLIGRTLKHSFSKTFFTKKFSELHLTDCLYESFELAGINELPSLLRSFPDLEGLNVTIPYKEDVLPFLNVKSSVVEETGACNCIRIREGRLYGHNTDVTGFSESLRPHLKPHHQKALVLGTGGASKAVTYSLRELGIGWSLVSRRQGPEVLDYSAINPQILQEHTLIVNTTPVGMYPNVEEAPPLPYEFLDHRYLLYDLVYNPEKTLFLKLGEDRGAQIVNGYEMLVIQAEESWKIWNAVQ